MSEQEINPNDRLEAVWCVDSETSEQVLIDRITNKRLAHKGVNGETVWEI